MMLNSSINGRYGDIFIALDHPDRVYEAGSMISGKVHTRLDKSEFIIGLTVKISGKGSVGWTETGTKSKNAVIRDVHHDHFKVAYFSEETYFTDRIDLLGATKMPSGMESFVFSTQLPSYLPGSYRGDHGHITYTIKVKLKHSSHINQTSKTEFELTNKKDLNKSEQVKKPISRLYRKDCGFLCFGSVPMKVLASLPHTGITPGQSIDVLIEATTPAYIDIYRLVIKVIQKVIWISHKPEMKQKITSKSLATSRVKGVGSRSSKIWAERISIPNHITYTNFDLCNIIKMQHLLQIVGEVRGLHRDVKLNIPLTLGTVPLDNGYTPTP